ncbi:hypothetical protein M426DRAFT_129187 [Hypoxylon sp. CI-4A]|nr:hypothetical protein M426DRAFT_129187 [Hypoxylon sp. CI-4A]
MPSRRVLPTLSLFSKQSTTPPTSSPPSPTRRTSLPMTPPARLHLRNILPTSPAGMPTPPPPPRQPYPWLWQCHSCSTVWRLGCTRRCLICAHEYCVSSNPPKTRRGKGRRRGNAMCASEFDYNGWAEWGAWRRKVLGLETADGLERKKRERAFAERSHNCVVDCDFPSECHHERYRLHTEALQQQQLESLLGEADSPTLVASGPTSHEDDLPLNKALDIEDDEDEDAEQDSPTSPTSPRSPVDQTSFFWDQADNEEEKSWLDSTEREEEKCRPKSRRDNRKSVNNEPFKMEVGGPNPTTIHIEDMDSDMLYTFLEEDENMMPIETVGYALSRCKSNDPSREYPSKYSKKWEETDDSSDSDSDDSSFSSPSSASSFDEEWHPDSEETLNPEGSDSSGKGETDRGLEVKNKETIMARTFSFLKD